MITHKSSERLMVLLNKKHLFYAYNTSELQKCTYTRASSESLWKRLTKSADSLRASSRQAEQRSRLFTAREENDKGTNQEKKTGQSPLLPDGLTWRVAIGGRLT